MTRGLWVYGALLAVFGLGFDTPQTIVSRVMGGLALPIWAEVMTRQSRNAIPPCHFGRPVRSLAPQFAPAPATCDDGCERVGAAYVMSCRALVPAMLCECIGEVFWPKLRATIASAALCRRIFFASSGDFLAGVTPRCRQNQLVRAGRCALRLQRSRGTNDDISVKASWAFVTTRVTSRLLFSSTLPKSYSLPDPRNT